MSRAIWWTSADQAELDVLVNAVVRAGFAHKSCAECRARNTWCKPMREAADAMLDWLRARQLLSRAQFLRDVHDLDQGVQRDAA